MDLMSYNTNEILKWRQRIRYLWIHTSLDSSVHIISGGSCNTVSQPGCPSMEEKHITHDQLLNAAVEGHVARVDHLSREGADLVCNGVIMSQYLYGDTN